MENLIYIDGQYFTGMEWSGSIQGMEPVHLYTVNLANFIGGAYILSVFQAPNEVSSAYAADFLNNEKLHDIT